MSDPKQEKNKQSNSQECAANEMESARPNADQNAGQKKSSKARFAAPLIPGGVVAALLIASLAGYKVPVYSANIEELALASDTTADEDSAITLPDLTEQPDEGTTSSGDTIESISAIDESDAKYKDGTYTGTGTGWGGTITVQVVIKNGLIASVTILSAPDETPEYFTKAKSITSAIVKAQSTNVDTVSGATYSSNGIIEAVRNALAKAGGSSSSSSSGGSSSGSNGSSGSGSSSSKTTAKTLAVTDESSAQYADGTWTGTGEGWGGNITVNVKIKNGVIKKITVADASDETPEYFNQAKAVITYIINAQSTNVDTVSGATFSSNGIIEAVRDALSKAAAAAGNTTTGDDTDAAASDTADDMNGTGDTDTGSGSDSDTSGDLSDSSGDDNDADDSDGSEENGDSDVSDGTTSGDSETDPDDSDVSTDNDADDDIDDDADDDTADSYTMLNGTYSIETTVYCDEWEDFYDYQISMLVTIESDAITAIDDITGDTDTTNQAYLKLAANGNKKYTGVVAQIIAAGNADDIDVVSGATCSSNAIITGAKLAIEEATAAKASE